METRRARIILQRRLPSNFRRIQFPLFDFFAREISQIPNETTWFLREFAFIFLSILARIIAEIVVKFLQIDLEREKHGEANETSLFERRGDSLKSVNLLLLLSRKAERTERVSRQTQPSVLSSSSPLFSSRCRQVIKALLNWFLFLAGTFLPDKNRQRRGYE